MTEMEVKDYITIGGIFITFFVSTISLYVSLKNSNKIAFINSVTSSRMKWIDELRNDISEFCGLITHYRITDNIDEGTLRELYEEIDILTYRIQLKLNRSDEPDKYIIRKLDFILDNLESKTDVPDEEVEELIKLTQDLLKFEWERVKLESKKGDLSKMQKNILIKDYLEQKHKTI